jgi:hypothetical protein
MRPQAQAAEMPVGPPSRRDEGAAVWAACPWDAIGGAGLRRELAWAGRETTVALPQ